MTAPVCVVVFPGQGSQRAGMARDFDRVSAVASAAFDEASEALGLDLRALCFRPDPRLDATEYLQPALLTAEIAMLRSLVAEHGLRPTHFGGHSLGEYTALVAAGVLPLAAGVCLVRERGRLMQLAVRPGAGAMVAVTGRHLEVEDVERCLAGLQAEIAAVNATGQIVVSGPRNDVETACARLRAVPAIAPPRLHPLPVSIPFHCSLLSSAQERFAPVLADAARSWSVAPAARVASNYTGVLHVDDRESIVDSLTRQITGRVRWLENARTLMALRPARVVEVGPSSVLRAQFMLERVPVSTVVSVAQARALERLAA